MVRTIRARGIPANIPDAPEERGFLVPARISTGGESRPAPPPSGENWKSGSTS
jgi:hypothetical protein